MITQINSSITSPMYFEAKTKKQLQQHQNQLFDVPF